MQERLRVVLAGRDPDLLGEVRELLASTAEARLVGETGVGSRVVDLVDSTDAELVLLDMGVRDPSGMAVLEDLRARKPDVTVIVLSALSSARATMEALSLGALEYVCTESAKLESTPLAEQLNRAIHNAWTVRSKTVTRCAATPARPRPSQPLCRKFDIVLIGISTGGPAALEAIAKKLRDADLPPVLIVQHMGRFFTEQLAQSLSRVSGREVREGRDGQLLEPGSILLAPGGMQCEIGRVAPDETSHRLRIQDAEPFNGYQPSVDVTWNSFARHFEGDILAILMTGMGEDGAQGMASLRERGAVCVAQDEASSVVWGMPGAAVAAGTPHEVLSLEGIADLVGSGVTRR